MGEPEHSHSEGASGGDDHTQESAATKTRARKQPSADSSGRPDLTKIAAQRAAGRTTRVIHTQKED